MYRRSAESGDRRSNAALNLERESEKLFEFTRLRAVKVMGVFQRRLLGIRFIRILGHV